jgi:NAD(P)-dependent dehydrogenase (short-subunit alcohol dehydrogenase family)
MLYEGKVAVVTGGASGFGKGVAERMAAEGASVVVADLDGEGGREVAREIEGIFVECDVSRPEASDEMVEVALEEFGGLDIAFLNAGIGTGCGVAEHFDLESYRRAMGVNLDGVVFGINSVVPAMRERGGGQIVATSSLAGLTAVPMDPIYAANKHAVVGLVRSLGPIFVQERIHLNAICPGFSDTAIIEPFREMLVGEEIPIIPVSVVVDAVIGLIDSGESGQCRFVQAGVEPQDFRFRNVPGAR